MGIFNAIKRGFDAVRSGVEDEVKKIQNADQARASLAIVALTAGADDEIEPEERKAGAEFVRKGTLFQAFDRSELAATLEDYYAKATSAILKEDLFDVIRKVKGKPDAARAVVKVGIGIARSDGEFEDAEKAVLCEVCQALGLDPASFPGLAA